MIRSRFVIHFPALADKLRSAIDRDRFKRLNADICKHPQSMANEPFIHWNSLENPMKNAIAIFVLSIAASFASTGAMAQAQIAPQTTVNPQRMERAMQQLQTRFAAANTTRDGKLTQAQAAQGMPMVAQNFDQIDTQKAGYITLAQIEQFMRQRATSH
jgi:hypothetical protein